MMSSAVTLLTPRHVAVIGAGAAGLVAARELRREGHRVVVFEKGEEVGGMWVYSPEVDSDPLGLEAKRRLVHSSLYDSLRTNLSRESMSFRDYPFRRREGKGRDSRRFPGHREVLLYLQDFAAEFEIGELVRFGTGCVCCSFIKIQKDLDQVYRNKKKKDIDFFLFIFLNIDSFAYLNRGTIQQCLSITKA